MTDPFCWPATNYCSYPPWSPAGSSPAKTTWTSCPVLNMPSGFADNGVPTGLQIVGRPYADVSVFRAGAAYERLHPWLDVRERRSMQSTPHIREV